MAVTKVLLVDDEAALTELMAERLSLKGYDVITAPSGDEALRKLESARDTDVVILDLIMPGMSGIDALLEVKEMLPLVEVIILTGKATVETAVQGIKRGAFDYLIKPCDTRQMVEKVNAADAIKKKREAQVLNILSTIPKMRKRLIDESDVWVRKHLALIGI